MIKKYLILLLAVVFVLSGCGDFGGSMDSDTSSGEEINNEDIGMTVQEALAKKDFVGPDNVSTINKNIFVGIISETKVFNQTDEIEYYILVYTPLREKLVMEITLTNDFTDTTIKNTHDLSQGIDQQKIKGKFKATSLGIHHFSVVVKDTNDNEIMNQTKDIAVMKIAENPSTDSFFWGVQPFIIRSIEYNENYNGAHCFVGLTPEETYQRVFDYIGKTGANLIRDGTSWAFNQPSRNVKNYSLMSRLVQDAKDKGYIIDWHLGATPSWAVETRFQSAEVIWNKPPRLEAWEDYISTVGELYANKSNVIMEIINECNWPDFFYGRADEYTAILDKSIDILKAANPDCCVINGGMVMPQANNFVTEESAKFQFEEDYIYYNKYKELIDADKMPYVAYHSHAYFKTFIEKDSVNMMYYLQDAGIAPNNLFLNESGMFNDDGMLQADDVIKKALWTKCNDHKGFVLFNFRDIDGGVLSPPGWGIITRDGQPKAAYPAYANIIEKLSGYKSKHIYANTLFNAYLMDNGTNNILVLFKDKSVPEINVTLPVNVSVKAYDMFGNVIESDYAKLSDNPVYIVYDGQVDPESIKVPVPENYKRKLDEYSRIENF